MTVESLSDGQQTSFVVKTAIFSPHGDVKLRETFIHLIYSNSVLHGVVVETILLNKENVAQFLFV